MNDDFPVQTFGLTSVTRDSHRKACGNTFWWRNTWFGVDIFLWILSVDQTNDSRFI